MNELISLLDLRERRLASRLGAALGIVACLFVFAAVRARGSARQAGRALAAAAAEAKTVEAERDAARTARQAWADAEKDMAKLKGGWMVESKNAARSLRLDLERIFQASGVAANDITYGYTDILRTRLKKVSIEFRFSGNYALLKGLLGVIERHPRLLLAEKIDVLSFAKTAGMLEFKIGLAGFYEE